MNEALITIFSGYHPDAYWDPSQLLNRKVNGGSTPPQGPRNSENAEAARIDVIKEQAKELVAAQAEIERLRRLLEEQDEEKEDWTSNDNLIISSEHKSSSPVHPSATLSESSS